MTPEETPVQETSLDTQQESLVAPEVVTEATVFAVINKHKGKRSELVDTFISKFITYQEYLQKVSDLEYLVAFDQYLLSKDNYDLALAEYEAKGDPDAILPTEPTEPVEEKIYVPESVESWKKINYSKLRAAAYPSKEEQLDMQYHDQVEGTTTWVDTIQSIKTNYPK